MKVKKQTLLILASIVWLIAGFNILRIGVISYDGYVNWSNVLISVVVFLIFWLMVFHKLVLKHTARIQNYEEELQFFWHFFDKKSFLIMAFMMTFGIGLRASHLAPTIFIAVFYSGLGTALFLAGILFGVNYFKEFATVKRKEK
ncbi:MAG: hypothetical protein Q4B39_07350 [[Ruminococcus] gnavus]|nr:hypothetical protein [Mediterraneibacter gnavus]